LREEERVVGEGGREGGEEIRAESVCIVV